MWQGCVNIMQPIGTIYRTRILARAQYQVWKFVLPWLTKVVSFQGRLLKRMLSGERNKWLLGPHGGKPLIFAVGFAPGHFLLNDLEHADSITSASNGTLLVDVLTQTGWQEALTLHAVRCHM